MFSARNTKVLLTCLFAFAIVVASSPVVPAYAGTNGQQIYVQSAQYRVTVSTLTIKGCNQNCVSSTFNKNLGFPGLSRYDVSNWWWKGTVKVTLGISTGYQSRQISCYISVPTWQIGNLVRVSFNDSSCWRS
jgi:hypothetical protein